jgi:hypothetical protein
MGSTPKLVLGQQQDMPEGEELEDVFVHYSSVYSACEFSGISKATSNLWQLGYNCCACVPVRTGLSVCWGDCVPLQCDSEVKGALHDWLCIQLKQFSAYLP